MPLSSSSKTCFFVSKCSYRWKHLLCPRRNLCPFPSLSVFMIFLLRKIKTASLRSGFMVTLIDKRSRRSICDSFFTGKGLVGLFSVSLLHSRTHGRGYSFVQYHFITKKRAKTDMFLTFYRSSHSPVHFNKGCIFPCHFSPISDIRMHRINGQQTRYGTCHFAHMQFLHLCRS